MFLTGDGAVLALYSSKTAERSSVHLRFVGANSTPELVPREPSAHKTSYFTGDGPSDFRTNIPNYARVLYRQIYPGIDVAFYGNNGSVEYDLLLQPGAHADQIELDFAGADKLDVDGSGDLRIHTSAGVLVQHRPVVFQERDGKREVIAADYRVLKGSKVRLQLASYDRSRSLTIDPVLSYSTYIGGGSSDSVDAMAVDAAGNAYIIGTSHSTNWPVVGAYQSRMAGSVDAVIAKVNPQGTGLVYSTYIGGRRSNTYGRAIAVDASGNAYMAGYSSSDTFPTTTGAYSAAIAGGGLVLTKLNAAGNGLVFSTYLKVPSEGALRIALDANGNAVVAGWTSDAIVTTAGAVQAVRPTPMYSNAGFITKLNSTGSGVIFSTYLGGSTDSRIQGVAVDPSGNVYVTGTTGSTDFPVTAGAYRGTPSGEYDAFVTKLNPAGTTLLYSTYLGGAKDDSGNAIAVDASGRAFITGDTFSTNFPVVNGNPKPASILTYNVAFIANLSEDGSNLQWSTLFGGLACLPPGQGWSCSTNAITDEGRAIAVDPTGINVYVAGYLSSIQVAGLVDSIQLNVNGGGDAFMAQLQADPFNPGRFNWRYATRFGGSNIGQANGIGIDAQGNAYMSGVTRWDGEADFPTTSGAFRVASPSPGDTDGFVTKLSTLSAPVMLEGDCPGAAGAPARLRASTALNATGNLNFTNGGNTLASVPIVGGMAAWSGPLPAGVYIFAATRSSDGVASRPMFCTVNQ